jgi:tetratricopeptide (TPR) repeat protein
LAAQLEQIYTSQGDTARAARFAELDRRFQRAARLSAEEAPPSAPAAAEFAIPPAPAEAVPEISVQPAAEAQPAGEAAVHEVDLSEEWAALSQMSAEPAAQAAPPPPKEKAPEEEIVLSLDEEPAVPAATEIAAEPATPAEAPAEVFDYELQAEPTPAPEPVAAQPPAQMTSSKLLSDLASEVDDLELSPIAPQEASVPAAAAKPAGGETVDQLKEVFNDFRQQMGAEEEVEDLETHYNLGIAYREMGLIEEAIGEFQRVGKAVQSGQTFRYAMQCYTLLGLSFMDKGQPGVAAMWYERALQTPGLDQESILALRYDLGVAQESAGSIPAALDSFTQVYAMNIDYRDIAERIAALQKRR